MHREKETVGYRGKIEREEKEKGRERVREREREYGCVRKRDTYKRQKDKNLIKTFDKTAERKAKRDSFTCIHRDGERYKWRQRGERERIEKGRERERKRKGVWR